MDFIFILEPEPSISCYRYNANLRGRATFITDKRFLHTWSADEQEPEELAWKAEMKDAGYYDDATGHYDRLAWLGDSLAQCVWQDPLKTLIVMDFDVPVGELFLELLRDRLNLEPDQKQPAPAIPLAERMHTTFPEKVDRWLVLSFFNNDEDTSQLLFNNEPEELIDIKADWIKTILDFPFIKTVEVPHNYTLTEDYLRMLFEHFTLNRCDFPKPLVW